MTKRSATLISLKAEGTLSASTKTSRQKVQFEGNLYKRDSLYIALYGPLGITVGKLQSVPQNAQFYYALSNTVFEGPPTRENFLKFNVPISHDDVTTFLRGDVPGGLAGFTPVQHDKAGEEMYIRQKDTTTERLIYSLADQAMTEYRMSAKTGVVLMRVQSSNFVTVAGVRVAQDVMMQFPPTEASLDIQCTSVEANLTNLKYSFVPPSSAARKKF
jgi:hypothetical protein